MEFHYTSGGSDQAAFEKVCRLRKAQEQDEGITKNDEKKDLAFMMRGEELMGSTVLYIPEGSKTALIEHFLVSGLARGLGVGGTLLKHVVEALKERGIQKIVEFKGCPSIQFWLKQGFVDRGEKFEADYGEIDVVSLEIQ